MGHLGLTPQSVNLLGGMKVQARTRRPVEILAAQASELENAGCFALVLECVPFRSRAEGDGIVEIPTIWNRSRGGL